MSGLLARIQANTRCTVVTPAGETAVSCEAERVDGALVCQRHLGDLYGNRLDRRDDGTYVERRSFRAKDLTGAA